MLSGHFLFRDTPTSKQTPCWHAIVHDREIHQAPGKGLLDHWFPSRIGDCGNGKDISRGLRPQEILDQEDSSTKAAIALTAALQQQTVESLRTHSHRNLSLEEAHADGFGSHLVRKSRSIFILNLPLLRFILPSTTVNLLNV